MPPQRRKPPPVTARVRGGGTRQLNSDGDAQEQAIRQERHKRIAKRTIDKEEQTQGGDEELFLDWSWDEIEAVHEVPLGPDGILPESGAVWLHGPAGQGKTILAYWILLKYARSGFECGMYEVEMGQERSKGLMLNLGAKWSQLKKIHYYRAEDPTDIVNLVAHGRALDRRLRAAGIDILLYDASNPLMVAAELSENDASDVRTFINTAVRPVTSRGGLVIILDHNRKGGSNMRGSSDKPAAGDAIIALSTTKAFARGISGNIRLQCTKDRNGTIKPDATLDIDVTCEEDGSIELEVGKWNHISSDVKQGIDNSKQDAKTQAKVWRLLYDKGPMSVPDIADEMGISTEAVRSALRRGGVNRFRLVRRGIWRAVE
jgi:hypothetical protein